MEEKELRDYVEIAIEMTDAYGRTDGISTTYIMDDPESGSEEIELLCKALSRLLIIKGYSGTAISTVQHINWNWIDGYNSKKMLEETWTYNRRFLVSLEDKTVDFDIWDGDKFVKYGDKVIAWAEEIVPYGEDPYDY